MRQTQLRQRPALARRLLCVPAFAWGTLSFKGQFLGLRAARLKLKAQRSHSLRELSPPFAANLFIGDAMSGLVTPTALGFANCPVLLVLCGGAGRTSR